MPKKPPLLLTVDHHNAVPLQTQICARLKALIEAGALAAGAAVPSSRDLASELDVSRNTVVGAYDRLLGEGYLTARERSGLFVSNLMEPGGSLRSRPIAAKPKSPTERARAPLMKSPLPFRPSQPDIRLFPLAVWNRMRTRALKTYGYRMLGYQEEMRVGLPALRKSLAEYLRSSRGVQCDWRNIVVTSGSQQAIYILAQLLVPIGGRVLMEDPGYRGARLAWLSRDAEIQPLTVDRHGLMPPPFSTTAAVVYATPSRQYPTGACLPVARRFALIDWAVHTGSYVIEDDYDSEFRYTRPPLPSVQGLDRDGRVIYVGTTSKSLFPSMRIGYVVLPDPLVQPFSDLRGVIDDQGPLIDQATLAEFIDSGAFYTHIRRCRREYGQRREAFLDAVLASGLPLRFPHTDGGMNLAGFFHEGLPVDETALQEKFTAEGFDIPPLSRYSLAAPTNGLLFGFTAFGPAKIRTEVARLARILDTARSK